MNSKKRMDLSLFDQMIEVILLPNFKMNILGYPLSFNQVRMHYTTQLKSQFHLVCYHHGPNQSRGSRVQLRQYRFHQFQTDLHIFLCKD